jgi:hypothetical protein
MKGLLDLPRCVFYRVIVNTSVRDIKALLCTCKRFKKIIMPRMHFFLKLKSVQSLHVIASPITPISTTTINQVPSDVLECIFQYSGRNMIRTLACVCSTFKNIITENKKYLLTNEANYTLYAEQQEMYDYVSTSKNRITSVKSIPGSGKTAVQLMLALDKAERGEICIIVIPPKTMNTWVDEARKFGVYNINPALSKVLIYHTQFKKHQQYITETTFGNRGCVLVTTPYYMKSHNICDIPDVSVIMPVYGGDLYHLALLKSYNITLTLSTISRNLSDPLKLIKHLTSSLEESLEIQKYISIIFDESHLQANLISICSEGHHGIYRYRSSIFNAYKGMYEHQLLDVKLYLFSASDNKQMMGIHRPITKTFEEVIDDRSSYARLNVSNVSNDEIHRALATYNKIIYFSDKKAEITTEIVKNHVKHIGKDVLVVKFESTKLSAFEKFKNCKGSSILCCNYKGCSEGLNFNMADCAILENISSMAIETTRQCFARISRRNNVHQEVRVLWDDLGDDVNYVKCKINILHALGSWNITTKKTSNAINEIVKILTLNKYDVRDLTELELCIIFTTSTKLNITQEHIDKFKIPMTLLLSLTPYW